LACLERDNIWRLGENMAKEITLVELQTMSSRLGLRLSDEELEKLLPGVNRSHHQILELRELITDSIEPAAAFVASRTEKK
jgi:Ca2+-binding EF-hand superfamily protein